MKNFAKNKGFTPTPFIGRRFARCLRQHPDERCRGFTLIETLVVITVFTMIIGGLIASIKIFYRSNTFTLEQTFAVNNARKGTEFFVRDIREATFGDDGGFPVIAISSSSLSFYSDVDRDNSVERIRYSINGELLEKGITQPSGSPPIYNLNTEATSTVAEHVRNWEDDVTVFRYYDDTGTEITNFTNVIDVAFITMNLIVNINPIRLPNEFTLRSSATLRNLKTNL